MQIGKKIKFFQQTTLQFIYAFIPNPFILVYIKILPEHWRGYRKKKEKKRNKKQNKRQMYHSPWLLQSVYMDMHDFKKWGVGRMNINAIF